MLSQRKKQHLLYLYRGGGLPAVLAWLVRALLSPLYLREARYIVAQKLPDRSPLDSLKREKEETKVEFLILTSPEAFQVVEGEVPSAITYPLESLRQHVAQGGVIFVVFCPKGSGQGRAFVGYEVAQRGVLSVLGREKAVPLSILVTRYGETLPEYRGRKYGDVVRVAREEYCRQNGIQVLCGTIAPDNRSSLKVTLRIGYRIVGTAVRVSLLRGRFVIWETPWEKIEAALQDFIQQERPS